MHFPLSPGRPLWIVVVGLDPVKFVRATRAGRTHGSSSGGWEQQVREDRPVFGAAGLTGGLRRGLPDPHSWVLIGLSFGSKPGRFPTRILPSAVIGGT